MELRTGTSGFSYDAWKGAFYPEGLPAKQRLAYYATQLPAVEINNTFYRLPKVAVLEGWAEQVPESFRFVIKASRRITHFKRLKDPGDETDYLMETVRTLGPRLGCVLFQLPPTLKVDVARLESFLQRVPEDVPAAFEFRHASWHDAGVLDLLRARNCAWVDADTDDEPLERLVRTASWGYLRLRGSAYSAAALRAWAARLAEPGWREAFVFFKHEDDAAGPRWAGELRALAAGAPAKAPPRPARTAARRKLA
jgi:uncharacterized protein YecE (DUF72 family)